jgi:hypothetical protein
LESEDLGWLGEMDTIPRKTSFLIPPLPLIEDEEAENAKTTDIIEFTLKQKAGSSSTGSTYKLKVNRFCEGTVSEWIDFRKAIKEVWKQNGISSPSDRVANLCTILRGDSLAGFEEKIQELTTDTDVDGNINQIALSDEIVLQSLNAVALTVFPFRALETQKQWMRRRMRKPKELSLRKTVAAVGRLNNSLPLFPNGSDSDKFTPEDIMEILEWSIPEAWRTKFDLDGYVPTEFGKARFITECEAIERNEPKTPKASTKSTLSGKTVAHKKSHGVKFQSGTTPKRDSTSKYFCTEHGHNPTHGTDKCYTLKYRSDKGKPTSSSGLTKQSFRKEINILSKGRPRKKILEMFAVVLQQEHKKLAGKKTKKAKTTKKVVLDVSSDSEDGDMSVDHIERESSDKGDSPSDSPSERKTDETDEDQTYLARIENLGNITNVN